MLRIDEFQLIAGRTSHNYQDSWKAGPSRRKWSTREVPLVGDGLKFAFEIGRLERWTGKLAFPGLCLYAGGMDRMSQPLNVVSASLSADSESIGAYRPLRHKHEGSY